MEVFVLSKLDGKAIPPSQIIQFPPQRERSYLQTTPRRKSEGALQVSLPPSNYQHGPPLCTDTISNAMSCFFHSRLMVSLIQSSFHNQRIFLGSSEQMLFVRLGLIKYIYITSYLPHYFFRDIFLKVSPWIWVLGRQQPIECA